MSDLEELRERLLSIKTRYESAQSNWKRSRKELKVAKKVLSDIEKAQAIIQSVAKDIQHQAHRRITGVVSRCLKAVMGDDYDFKLEFVSKRRRTETRMTFLKDGREMHPTEGSGGGVLDVASFALRLARLLFAKPQGRRILIADEPFRMLDADKTERLASFLLELSRELDLQIILSTHNKGLQVGKVIEFN